MLSGRKVVAAFLLTALGFAACSDPDGYPGGGRYETLPGQAGGLVAVEAGPPSEAGGPPPIATDASE